MKLQEKKIIEDLHGNVFQLSEVKVSRGDTFPTIFHDKEVRVFTKDLVSGESFVLVKDKLYHQIKPGDKSSIRYGYVQYKNELYLYGNMGYLGYKSYNDIRANGKVKKERTKKVS